MYLTESDISPLSSRPKGVDQHSSLAPRKGKRAPSVRCDLSLVLGQRPLGGVSSAHIVQSLSEAITTGQIPVGAKLGQQALADFFGVSRMPVREAMSALHAKGLIAGDKFCTPIVRHVPGAQSESHLTEERIVELKGLLSEAHALITECISSGVLPPVLLTKASTLTAAQGSSFAG